jgi:multimeric flavodoxin WrbA/uncharacterized Zn finger protein (UPF0148 family)
MEARREAALIQEVNQLLEPGYQSPETGHVRSQIMMTKKEKSERRDHVTEKKKIIGLSCGRKNGNSEYLLKEALMGAEELGVESEIIRAMELRVKPCTGCETCSMSLSKGGPAQCAIKDDDVPWILEKTVVEDAALIVSAPVYHLIANNYLIIINHRMLPTLFNHPDVIKKTRVGGIISVGGGEPEWTSLGLLSANIFLQHSRILVDQFQVNGATRPGAVLVDEKSLKRARKLGQNIAKAMMMPPEEVKFVGDETDISCPVCHCDVLQVPKKLPNVVCPVCDVHGFLTVEGGKMKVEWNKQDAEYPRFSPHGVSTHLEEIKEKHIRYFREHHEKVQGLRKKYAAYGTVIKP